MNSNPVLVILNGLAAVVAATLVATNALGVTHLEPVQGAAVVAAVTAWCNLLGFAIRATVVPVAQHEQAVAQALATPTPGQTVGALTPAAPQGVLTFYGSATSPTPPDPLPGATDAVVNAMANRQAAGA